MNQFSSKRPSFEYLRNKWGSKEKLAQQNFWDKHASALKHLALGSVGSLMLLSSPSGGQLPAPNLLASSETALLGFDKNVLLAQILSTKVPSEARVLEKSEENDIADILSFQFGFVVKAEIDNIRLNRNYGLIGGEQHLYRYPGDTLISHADSSLDWAKYGDAGIAPGLGAWGYFTSSKAQFSDTDKQREKYYIAVQTFLSPGFAENFGRYRDFFKYRKMLVVNPKTGQAVVAVIGDAGPGEFTGKHLGGSPEIMDNLGLATGPRKGAVLYFFIDDPEDSVPLGPIKVRSNLS